MHALTNLRHLAVDLFGYNYRSIDMLSSYRTEKLSVDITTLF